MNKRCCLFAGAIVIFALPAHAITCSSLTSFPYTLANGTTADATQVMANFTYLGSCAAPIANPDFTGVVGIATASPLSNMTLDTYVSSGPFLVFSGSDVGFGSTSAGWSMRINLGEIATYATDLRFDAGWSTVANNNLIFRTANTTSGPTEHMRITSAGNVGIGTATPAQALEVNGEVQVDTFASASATAVCENAGVLSSCSSSIRYKEDVADAPFGLSDVMQMRPVTFKWKGRDEKDIGLIAEEVAKIDPLFVTYKDGKVEGVKYAQLTAVLVNAVKTLKNANDGLAEELKKRTQLIESEEQELSTLKNENTVLKAKFTSADQRLDKIEARLGVRNASIDSPAIQATNARSGE